ncbi:hypothetical protein DUNSADRAFT_7810, partial [Dunaliella salina]
GLRPRSSTFHRSARSAFTPLSPSVPPPPVPPAVAPVAPTSPPHAPTSGAQEDVEAAAALQGLGSTGKHHHGSAGPTIRGATADGSEGKGRTPGVLTPTAVSRGR